ncbi:MAG: hypothetical protein K2L22_03310 [Muribaculaceae bacterium]|nr:hypothetical protein [Muribaculaceae bacterium]
MHNKSLKDECNTLLEQWIYNIKNMGRTQNVAFTEQNDIFRYLESVSNYAALTPEERDDYEAALMRVRDYNAVLVTAKEKAMEEGRAEGRAEEKYEMARRMKAIPIPAETIMQITGLSKEELASL